MPAVSFLVLLLLCAHSAAQAVSSTELIEKAREYDNTVVEYEGEAVGAVMTRGECAWVNLHDGVNALGIWGPAETINHIVKRKGYYNCKGDIISIMGEFHRACAGHGGDMDIHMTAASRVKDGYAVAHELSGTKAKTAFGLAFAALGLAALAALRSRKRKWKKG